MGFIAEARARDPIFECGSGKIQIILIRSDDLWFLIPAT